MTEEIKDPTIPTPEELAAGIKKEPEVKEQEDIVTAPDYEKQARVKGWRPEEEYEGETPWVDAKEFVGRQPLFDAIHKLSKKNKDLDVTVNNLVEHNRKVEKAAYKKAVEDLKAQKIVALENQDHATVIEIDDQIDEVKREAASTSAPKSEESPEFAAFLERNSWYGEKQNMARYATRIGEEYWASQENPSRTAMLAHVEEVVRDAYPEEFAPKENPKRKASQAVASPKAGSIKPKGRAKLTKNDLSYEERVVLNNMLRNSPLTEEEYLDQLADTRA